MDYTKALNAYREREMAVLEGLDLNSISCVMNILEDARLQGKKIFTHKKFESLTEREIDILKLIAQGKTTQEISSYLEISPLTVATHVKNIFGKMQVRTRAQAVRYAMLTGII